MGSATLAADQACMEAAAPLTDLAGAEWRVQRDGSPVATVATRRDEAGIVVSTRLLEGPGVRIRPYRFADSSAADSFVRDLVASFSYLGCQVAKP